MTRAALTRPRVISEARQLAEQIGLEQLTMTALAQHLGVRMPSLYKHVASLAELRRSISAIAARELGNEIAGAALDHGGVSAIAQAYRQWALRYPDRYRASQVPPAPGDLQHEAVVAAVARTFAAAIAVPATRDRLDHARAARATLHGFVTLEMAHAFGAGIDVDRSFARTIHGLVVAFDSQSLNKGNS